MYGLPEVSRLIWDEKYRLKSADGTALDRTIEDTWTRVANAVAEAEAPHLRAHWSEQFNRALEGFKFMPAGRIVAGAGAGRSVTLFNCFVVGAIHDDMRGIFDTLRDAALTMQAGGGIGCDFSTIRPHGSHVRGTGSDAAGPVPFMDVWDAMCRTIMSAGARRGAMMACLRCDHPDIEAFIEAKRDPSRLRNFNLSVLVTGAFMNAVERDSSWDLTFNGKVYRTISARGLWDRIMTATYAYAEPGVIFIDRVNAQNPLSYCETISATNPCGEQPLPPFGACLLGSLNLGQLVRQPFSPDAQVDLAALDSLTRTAVRFLDNVVDVSPYPLAAQEREAKGKRRIGLGVTGLADALIFCGVRYGSPQAVALTERWLRAMRRAAILASAALSAEKGAFPLFERDKYLATASAQNLEPELRAAIAEKGLRNGLLTSIAPTGTISLVAHNASSGVEPVFAFEQERLIRDASGAGRTVRVENFAYATFRALQGASAPLPPAFVSAQDLDPMDHVAMQAAAQPFIDSAISKTVNVPRGISFAGFKDVYRAAYDAGCKGCTTFRPNEITGSVLSVAAPREPDPGPTPAAAPQTPAAARPSPAVAAPIPAAIVRDPVKPKPADRPPAPEAAGIVYMTKPLDRPEALAGATYKVRWPDSDHAMYITLNDMLDQGRRRPFEIFINSKNMEHYAWTVALTRMISAVFRRGGDVSFVVEELKSVFDPRGGHWIDKQYVPSLLAAIGRVIEEHLISIGFMVKPADASPKDGATAASPGREPGEFVSAMAALESGSAPRRCPKCSAPGLLRIEGCDTCPSCDYSRCG
jgi:ribonucleoside-diphosphate reductase alpha chain